LRWIPPDYALIGSRAGPEIVADQAASWLRPQAD
jgi:hypothetical protein